MDPAVFSVPPLPTGATVACELPAMAGRLTRSAVPDPDSLKGGRLGVQAFRRLAAEAI
jgi:hypothetical protein